MNVWLMKADIVTVPDGPLTVISTYTLAIHPSIHIYINIYIHVSPTNYDWSFSMPHSHTYFRAQIILVLRWSINSSFHNHHQHNTPLLIHIYLFSSFFNSGSCLTFSVFIITQKEALTWKYIAELKRLDLLRAWEWVWVYNIVWVE